MKFKVPESMARKYISHPGLRIFGKESDIPVFFWQFMHVYTSPDGRFLQLQVAGLSQKGKPAKRVGHHKCLRCGYFGHWQWRCPVIYIYFISLDFLVQKIFEISKILVPITE